MEGKQEGHPQDIDVGRQATQMIESARLHDIVETKQQIEYRDDQSTYLENKIKAYERKQQEDFLYKFVVNQIKKDIKSITIETYDGEDDSHNDWTKMAPTHVVKAVSKRLSATEYEFEEFENHSEITWTFK